MLTIIESPFVGDPEINWIYLKRAVLNSIKRGETPFASHGFYPQFLDDRDPEERKLGINLGFGFWRHANLIAFYTDYGMSVGMTEAFELCARSDKPRIMRSIGKNDAPY